MKIISYSLLSPQVTIKAFFPVLLNLNLPIFPVSTSNPSRFAANPAKPPSNIHTKQVTYGSGNSTIFDGFLIQKYCPDSILYPVPSSLPIPPSQFCFHCHEEQQ